MNHRQQMFDTIVKGLRKQGKKSKRGKYCAFRGAGNRKCAVGWLMPDNLYDLTVEGHSVEQMVYGECVRSDAGNLIGKFWLQAWGGRGRKQLAQFLLDAQNIHDAEDVESWDHCFEKMANDWGLEYPYQ